MNYDSLALAILTKMKRDAELKEYKALAYFWMNAYKRTKVNFQIKPIK